MAPTTKTKMFAKNWQRIELLHSGTKNWLNFQKMHNHHFCHSDRNHFNNDPEFKPQEFEQHTHTNTNTPAYTHTHALNKCAHEHKR